MICVHNPRLCYHLSSLIGSLGSSIVFGYKVILLIFGIFLAYQTQSVKLNRSVIPDLLAWASTMLWRGTKSKCLLVCFYNCSPWIHTPGVVWICLDRYFSRLFHLHFFSIVAKPNDIEPHCSIVEVWAYPWLNLVCYSISLLFDQ